MSVSNLDDVAQKSIEEFIQTVGLPLIRIRKRLEIQDWQGLADAVDQLYRDQLDTPVSRQNARRLFWINLAQFQNKLKLSQRSLSLIPLMKASEIWRSHPHVTDDLSNTLISKQNLKQGFHESLLPIWFNLKNASDVAETLVANSTDRKLMTDGELIYRISLFATSGHPQNCEKCLSELQQRSSVLAQNWLPLMKFMSSKDSNKIRILESELKNVTNIRLAIARFLLARQLSSESKATDRHVLSLLSIAANQGRQYPGFAAASLFLASEISQMNGHKEEAQTMRSELSRKFGYTYHGSIVSQPKKD